MPKIVGHGNKIYRIFLIDYQRNFKAKHCLKRWRTVRMPNSESEKEVNQVLTA